VEENIYLSTVTLCYVLTIHSSLVCHFITDAYIYMQPLGFRWNFNLQLRLKALITSVRQFLVY